MKANKLSALLEAQQRVIEEIALGAELEVCLRSICEHIESIIDSPDAKSSILLLEGQQLRHGAAPRLPTAYCEAVDGIVIGPSVGSCGTAAFTGQQVIASDIEHDPRWSDYKSLALEHGLRSCWSTPIVSSRQKILGTFAIYYSQVKAPDRFHLDLISRFTHLSSLAIEKQQNVAELRTSENYSRTLFETSPIGLALCRLDGQLVDINPAYANIIGRSVKETLALSSRDITPEKYKEKDLFQLEKLELTGAYGPYEKEYIHKDGHLVPVRLSGMYLERNGECFIWSSVEDITQQRDSEQVLRRTQKMDAIGQLTGGIAHDFNNILGIVMGNLQILQKQCASDNEALERIESALKGTRRGAEITRRLLRFSRIETQGSKLTDVNSIIRNLDELVAKSLTVSINLQTQLSNDLWRVSVDPGDLEDAMLNLSLNARDAMPEGGTLKIETQNKVLSDRDVTCNPGNKSRDFIMISVSDNGIGMTDDVRDRALEPFFTTKQHGAGTGLGLSMVYGFVQRSGGQIKIYSEPGNGTAFHLFLPKAEEDEQAA